MIYNPFGDNINNDLTGYFGYYLRQSEHFYTEPASNIKYISLSKPFYIIPVKGSNFLPFGSPDSIHFLDYTTITKCGLIITPFRPIIHSIYYMQKLVPDFTHSILPDIFKDYKFVKKNNSKKTKQKNKDRDGDIFMTDEKEQQKNEEKEENEEKAEELLSNIEYNYFKIQKSKYKIRTFKTKNISNVLNTKLPPLPNLTLDFILISLPDKILNILKKDIICYQLLQTNNIKYNKFLLPKSVNKNRLKSQDIKQIIIKFVTNPNIKLK